MLAPAARVVSECLHAPNTEWSAHACESNRDGSAAFFQGRPSWVHLLLVPGRIAFAPGGELFI